MSIISDVIESTKAIIKGMSVTFSYIPKEKWTVQYPDEPITVQPRYRGQHLLHVDENGKEKCVACFLCAAACPSDCIYIIAKDDPRSPQERIGRDERYAEVYNIDYGRCIFCGYCVEACPKDAITHGYNFELSVYNRADLLKTKDDLLITKQKQSMNYRVASSDEDVNSEYKEV
ncbi:MAG: NADH-quinone oxidoreductase subunit I [Pyrinomonadaceae bacterium]